MMTASLRSLPLEKLDIVRMASGRSALLLSESVRWEQFPEFARHFSAALHAKVTDEADAPDVRVWQLTVEGELFYLAFDDFPGTVSLEARSDGASEMIGEIQKRLHWLREGDFGADDSVRPYARAELEQAGHGYPERGERCHRCGGRVPRFVDLSPSLESRLHELIRCGRSMAAMQELEAATKCPQRWAKVWVVHDGRAEARFPGPPCPYCGRPLRTSKARQCPHCHTDWHPPREPAG